MRVVCFATPRTSDVISLTFFPLRFVSDKKTKKPASSSKLYKVAFAQVFGDVSVQIVLVKVISATS